MEIFGLSAPVIIAGIIVIGIVITKVVPLILSRNAFQDYQNFDVRDSVAFFSFAGNSGAGYSNLKLEEDPIKHSNGKISMKLESLPRPFNDVNINQADEDCDIKVKQTYDMVFGIRVDVLCRIDASGNRYDWDDAYISSWDTHVAPLREEAALLEKKKKLEERELKDEFEGKPPFEKPGT